MRVVTFGELMLRLQPYNFLRFVQADSYEASYGGGEANVAVSLSNFGLDTDFVSILPDNEIGQAGINSLRRYGVGTKFIVRKGDKCGIYFLEKGASQRASKVIYDRKYSSFYFAQKDDFDWEKIFKDASWFHVSGITPAVNTPLEDITLQAVMAAKKMGLTVSLDLNYRSKLWSKESANNCLSKIAKYVDVCIGNEEDASDVFSITSKKSNVDKGVLDKESYKDVAKQLMDKFKFKKVAITLRTSLSASENKWSGMLYDGKDYCFSKEYLLHIVDRVGGGDSFSAGLIYSLLNNFSSSDAIEFAVAASCLKHSLEEDYNLETVDEINKIIESGGSGRVQR